LENIVIELGTNIYEKERKKKLDPSTMKKSSDKQEFSRMETAQMEKKRVFNSE